MKTLRNCTVWLLVVFSLLGGISCQESLPGYQDPRDVLTASNDALYVISILDNSLKSFVYLVNDYDETFQGRAFIDGTVTVTLASDPTFRKTFIASPSNILSGKYLPSSQQLTLDPGDTLKFIFSWNFVDDSGRDILDILRYHKDPTCQERFISEPQSVTIRSDIKVFEKINSASAIFNSYTFVHHRAWFHPKDCTPLPVN